MQNVETGNAVVYIKHVCVIYYNLKGVIHSKIILLAGGFQYSNLHVKV